MALTERSRQRLNERSVYPQSTYQDHGYTDRADYVQGLVNDHGIDAVRAIYSVLGPEEDFDGVVTGLEDFIGGF